MAKDSSKKAEKLGADKTGTLPGLIAEENQLDRRSLWRIGWWGMTAVGAVALAVVASSYAQGWRQDRIASADLTRQSQAIQSLARDTQHDQRQLTEAIETLNTDRDRLYARLTVLEQSLESVTGALRQTPAQAGSGSAGKTSRAPVQTAPTEPQAAAPSSPSAPQATAMSSGQDSNSGNTVTASSAAIAPAVAPVTTTSATVSDKSRQDASKLDAFNKAAPSTTASIQATSGGSSASTAAPWPASATSLPPGPTPFPPPQVATNTPASDAPASLVAPKSIMAPPDPAATRLVEPNKAAQSEQDSKAFDMAAAKPGDTAEPAPTPVQRTEFAVDLGTANSLSGLRTLWRGLVKSNSDLAPLRPIVILKEGNNGLGMQLRLGAGPLNDAAAAAKICAGLAENKRACETTVYDGQRLAVRADDKEKESQPPSPEVNKTTPMQNAVPGQKGHRAWPAQRRGRRDEPAASAAPSAAPATAPTEIAAPASGSSALTQLFRRS